MTRELGRRLDAVEKALGPDQQGAPLTRERWIELAAHEAVRLVYVLGPAEGGPMARLYAAIAAGNVSGDRVQSFRFSLRERFDWALRTATIEALGLPHANDWYKIELPNDAKPALEKLFAFYVAELPQRHPELIGPEAYDRPSIERRHSIGRDRKLYQGERLIEGPQVAAFGIEAWEGRN